MRFLLDTNVSFRVGSELAAEGHDVVHVDDLSMGDAPDREILERARHEERVIISADTDFGAYLASDRAAEPSVLLIREVSTLPSYELVRLLLANLEDLVEHLAAGAVVAVRRHDVRVRRLPLR